MILFNYANTFRIFKWLSSVAEYSFVLQPAPLDLSFYGHLAIILYHILTGKVTERFVSGIHYFNKDRHQIVKLTRESNSNGIWEAVIKVKIPGEETWITKDTHTTLFPTHWTKKESALHIKQAYTNLHKVSSIKYEGITEEGISIIFLLKKNKIISVYPRYE